MLIRAVIVAVLVATGTGLADASPAGRERIGLVLAGGGARGLSHAGVIRALEEFRIPIDAVSGTSMGALIGGLYASGMDADDLQEVIDGMDWYLAFGDTRSRRDMSPRRKADDYDYATRIGLTVDGRNVTIPIGIIQGQQVRVILKRLTMPASGIHDFDQLPTPYRAVATDIETGDMYVFSHGSLVTAMRASMSIPGLLAPVEHDGHMLVDGGLSSNVPINVARTMGVDRLIVIDIGSPLMPQEEIDNLIAVTDQTLNFLTRKNSDQELATLGPQDIVVKPDVGNFGVLDFFHAAEIYQLGYEAGLELRERLAPLALDEEEWEAWLATRELPEAPTPRITSIRIHDDSALSDDVIRTKISQEVDEPLDRAELAHDIEMTYALGYWDVLDYELDGPVEDTELRVLATARGRGDGALRLGLQLAADLDRTSALNIGGSFLLRGVNRRGAEFYARAEVGNRILVRTQWYQPVDLRARFFVAPWIGYEDEEVRSAGPEFDSSVLAGAWRVRRIRGEVVGGLNLPFRAQIRAGLFRSYGKYLTSSEFGDGLPDGLFDEGGLFGSARFDGLDDFFFPTYGTLLYGEITIQREELGADRNFEQWRGVSEAAFSFGANHRNVVVVSAKAGQNFHATNEPQNFLQLGGLFNLSGYGQYSLSGRQMALAMTRYQRRIAGDSVLPFGLRVFAGASFEGGQVWSEPSDMRIDDVLFGGSAFLAVDSPVGPLHVAYGYAGIDHHAFYLMLGWPFLTQDLRMER